MGSQPPPAAADKTETTDSPHASFKPDWHFWCIYMSLCLVTFADAIDKTVVFTALPTITRSLGGGDQYVWIAEGSAIPPVIDPFLIKCRIKVLRSSKDWGGSVVLKVVIGYSGQMSYADVPFRSAIFAGLKVLSQSDGQIC